MRSLNIRADVSNTIQKSPILRNNHELDSIKVNKGQIDGELEYFLGTSRNLI